MTSSFKEIQEIVAAIEHRKRKLFEQIRDNQAIIAGLEQQYDTAVLAGNDNEAKKILIEMKKALSLQNDLEKQSEVYIKEPQEFTQVIASNPRVKELCESIHLEHAEKIKKCRMKPS